METNQLETNEIVVKPSDFKDCKQSESSDKPAKIEKVWRWFESWLITIVTQEHSYALEKDPERCERMFKLFDFMLNDQKFFLENFFYFETNTRWKGPPGVFAVDISRFDWLHVRFVDEDQPVSKNKFLHFHIKVDIGFRPIMGLTIKFNGNLVQQLANEFFGHNFYMKGVYAPNVSKRFDFYLDKTKRGELK